MTALGLSPAVADGFNLLPYRNTRRREARNRRAALLVAASVVGCMAAGAIAGWDAFERDRLDVRRAALEASLQKLGPSLAEHARIAAERTRQSRARELAKPLAGPRARFLTLLDALGDASPDSGVALQRVSQSAAQHGGEVELVAIAPDSDAAARWMKRLQGVSGVASVMVVEMRRRVSTQRYAPADHAPAPAPAGYDVTALVRWAGNPAGAEKSVVKVAKVEQNAKRSTQ